MNKAAVYGLLPNEILPMQEEGDVVIIGDRPFPRTVAKQRKELEDRIRKEGFQQFIEAIAYTWFNRFVAIRYMELHGYLDHGYRVLSHPEGKSTPEILENAERIELPSLNRDEVVDLKLDGGKDEQLYQMLLLAQCNALHKAMPFLFESIKDGTELLLPGNLLHTDSLVRTLVNNIPEEQWENVEIIGWLYQFYISEKKDQVIGKVVKSEDIPAATQLFTPNWIVRYMLHNTLGRKWLATYPNSPLRQQMEFYIEPSEQSSEVQQQLDEATPDCLNPEELTLLDPACGSGHILVEAYDLFKAIYSERGYRARDIPTLILTKNLFGLEIDARAAQLAAFALMMKARADNRQLFASSVQPKVVHFTSTSGVSTEELVTSLNTLATVSDTRTFNSYVTRLSAPFENAATLGSLLRTSQTLAQIASCIESTVQDALRHGNLLQRAAAQTLQPISAQAIILAQKFSIVVTNPPYIGAKYMNPVLKRYASDEYTHSRSDAYAMFIERCLEFCEGTGHVGMVTPYVWMFISSFEKVREHLRKEATLTTLIQLEYNAFEPACVPVCTFTALAKAEPHFEADYISLQEFKGHETQAPRTLEAISTPSCPWRYRSSSSSFSNIPGAPVAYWLPDTIARLFGTADSVGTIVVSRQGMSTGDNTRFVLFWHEVGIDAICFSARNRSDAKASGKKWFPYNKGGRLRAWYGNLEHVVFWENDGEELRTRKHPSGRLWAHNFNLDFIFRESLTWSDIGIGKVCFRYIPPGTLFDTSGPSAFCDDHDTLLEVLGLANSSLVQQVTSALNPTMHFTPGDLNKLPFLQMGEGGTATVSELISIARSDWDSNERSWDFRRSPLLSDGQPSLIESAWQSWSEDCERRIEDTMKGEAANNSILANKYDLSDMVATVVSKDDITLCPADLEEDVKRLLSYAVGCMMGRYSLQEPGLIYAHGGNEGFAQGKYPVFPADEDGIVPSTVSAWFPDDVSNRFEQFIKTAWPEEYLEDNLNFVAKHLRKKNSETSRDCIRRHFATGFYKHHLSLYKKRPIYWLFSSGKQRAFQCLVYLHRYNPGTLARMRSEYVVKLQGKINARIEQLENDIPAAGSTSHRKKLEKEQDTHIKQREELQGFDEKLRHYADMRIDLDLNEGVKVNYGKFGDLLSEVKTVTGKNPA